MIWIGDAWDLFFVSGKYSLKNLVLNWNKIALSSEFCSIKSSFCHIFSCKTWNFVASPLRVFIVMPNEFCYGRWLSNSKITVQNCCAYKIMMFLWQLCEICLAIIVTLGFMSCWWMRVSFVCAKSLMMTWTEAKSFSDFDGFSTHSQSNERWEKCVTFRCSFSCMMQFFSPSPQNGHQQGVRKPLCWIFTNFFHVSMVYLIPKSPHCALC